MKWLPRRLAPRAPGHCDLGLENPAHSTVHLALRNHSSAGHRLKSSFDQLPRAMRIGWLHCLAERLAPNRVLYGLLQPAGRVLLESIVDTPQTLLTLPAIRHLLLSLEMLLFIVLLKS